MTFKGMLRTSMRNAYTRNRAIRMYFPLNRNVRNVRTDARYWSMRIRLCGYVPIIVSIFRRGAMHPDHTRPGNRARDKQTREESRSGTTITIVPARTSRYPGTTRHGKLHTHLRSSRGGLDTGREREAAKLRDESGEQPPVRARSIPGSSPARSRGSPRDRLLVTPRIDVEIPVSVSMFPWSLFQVPHKI